MKQTAKLISSVILACDLLVRFGFMSTGNGLVKRNFKSVSFFKTKLLKADFKCGVSSNVLQIIIKT